MVDHFESSNDVTVTLPKVQERIPTVVVDDAHVIYRIHKGAGGGGGPVGALKRIMSRTSAPNIQEVHAVKGVSFTAYRGEAVGLIGSNGSGKSTMLRAIAGLLPVNRGAVYTQGQPSLLGVNAALLNDLSGERNVVLGCLAMGMSPEEVQRQTPEIIDFSGINQRGDFASLPMRTYSSGMGARLRFSIAAPRSTTCCSSTRPSPPATRSSASAASGGCGSCGGRRHGVPRQPPALLDPGHLRTDDLAGIGRPAHGRPDRRGRPGVRGVQRQVAPRRTYGIRPVPADRVAPWGRRGPRVKVHPVAARAEPSVHAP